MQLNPLKPVSILCISQDSKAMHLHCVKTKNNDCSLFVLLWYSWVKYGELTHADEYEYNVSYQ